MNEPRRPETTTLERPLVLKTIPVLAVVDIEREQNGRRELAVGVVLAASSDHDSYTVELVNMRGGTELISASARELRVRHLV